MIPRCCYTIWFTQRVGSAALCEALRTTGIAGNPGEWLEYDPSIGSALQYFGVGSAEELRNLVWRKGSLNDDGVCGLKFGLWQPKFSDLLEVLRQLPDVPDDAPVLSLWETLLPSCRHILLSRRDKVRLAVSWWMAIQSGQWHRVDSDADSLGMASVQDVAPKYDGDAIYDLYQQALHREAMILEVLAESADYLKVDYEDFSEDPDGTTKQILRYLGLNHRVDIQPLNHQKLAGNLSETWVRRFKHERQL